MPQVAPGFAWPLCVTLKNDPRSIASCSQARSAKDSAKIQSLRVKALATSYFHGRASQVRPLGDSYVISGSLELVRAEPISAEALWRGIASELVTAACGWRQITSSSSDSALHQNSRFSQSVLNFSHETHRNHGYPKNRQRSWNATTKGRSSEQCRVGFSRVALHRSTAPSFDQSPADPISTTIITSRATTSDI